MKELEFLSITGYKNNFLYVYCGQLYLAAKVAAPFLHLCRDRLIQMANILKSKAPMAHTHVWLIYEASPVSLCYTTLVCATVQIIESNHCSIK